MSTANNPLPRTANERAKEQQLDRDGFAVSFAVMFGMAPLVSSAVIFLVKESQSRARHLQYVTGAKPWVYWSATYVHDFAVFMIAAFGSLLLFPIFDFTAFMMARWWILLLLYIMYGLAVLPLMYLLSFLMSEPSVAFVRLTMLNIVTGLGALTVISVLDNADPESADRWRAWFIMLPNYNMAQAMSDLYTNYQTQEIVAAPCLALGIETGDCCAQLEQALVELDIDFEIACTTDYMRWDAPGVGKYFFFLFIQAIAFPLMVLGVEYGQLFKSVASRRLHTAWLQAFPSDPISLGVAADPDVVAENSEVIALTRQGDGGPGQLLEHRRTGPGFDKAILIDNLGKVYGTGPLSTETHAVNNLSLMVKPGECFGLLGTNGAGKTTTFKMLTGDLAVSSGNAWLDGYSVTQHMGKIQENVGYCPQFDALVDLLTGRETLVMYAKLRGIPDDLVAPTVDRLLAQLDLDAHEHVVTQEYSGGTKRKLSMAIALVGNPSMLLLDEPTTGMDPVARQLLARTLLNAQTAGCSIVLTSHSMEECQALCNRLGIMVRGDLRCLGSPQHLRSRFGDAYTVDLRLAEPSHEQLAAAWASFRACFPASFLKKVNTSTLEIGIPYVADPARAPGKRTSMRSVFQVLAHMQGERVISDYSVSEATLHQIFLNITSDELDDEVGGTEIESKFDSVAFV